VTEIRNKADLPCPHGADVLEEETDNNIKR
jgi:hypothetical protein